MYQILSDICPSCKRSFRYNVIKMDNDKRHEIECPYCNSSVGWADGTDEVMTYPVIEG